MSADLFVTEYEIDCPLLCGGRSILTLRGWGEPTTVRPCADCVAKGGTAFDVRFTEAEFYMDKPPAAAWQHRDGLVTFGGAF